MVVILIMSEKLATLGLIKIKLFWSKGYGVINCVHDVTSKISRERSYQNLNVKRIRREKLFFVRDALSLSQ